MGDKPICPKCGSKQIIYRVTMDSYLCRVCGEQFPRENKKEGKKNG
jgi:hypothetical protein